MSVRPAPSFVRAALVPERHAPIRTTSLARVLWIRLFSSPSNALLTVTGVALLWFFLVPAVRFFFVDAVWEGQNRTSCLVTDTSQSIGACWPFVHAKITQFIYGFYPEPERWRVNLTFLLAAILLLPLLIPRLPAKRLNASLFFVAFPVAAFFLLHGGGITGFGVSWTVELLSSLADSVGNAGRMLAASGEAGEFGSILRLLGNAVASIGDALNWLGSSTSPPCRPASPRPGARGPRVARTTASRRCGSSSSPRSGIGSRALVSRSGTILVALLRSFRCCFSFSAAASVQAGERYSRA